jgi:magnesium transporter
VIRGLSVGVQIRRVFLLEAATGLFVGLLIAALAYPMAWLMLGSQPIAFVVSVSLVAACSVATVVAMSLPWLMTRLGRDPAFGSGPLATVVQDLLSLVIYFAIASTVLA